MKFKMLLTSIKMLIYLSTLLEIFLNKVPQVNFMKFKMLLTSMKMLIYLSMKYFYV